MRFYYQYEGDGAISAIVKSASAPLNVNQVVSDVALKPGIKRFDKVTKEIIYYKDVYDETGEEIVRIDVVEDTDTPREKISDKNILTKD